MKYSTEALLKELQDQTEHMLNRAIQEWQMISPRRFSAAPPGGGWSAAQCLDHLNGYGDYYLPLLEGAIQAAKAKEDCSMTFKSGWLGDYFAKLMEPSEGGEVKKKMKAFKQYVPGPAVDSDAAIARFIAQQEKLLELIGMASGLQLGKRAIPVSIAPFIRLKTGDTLRFVVAHNRRHVAQALRALEAAAGCEASSVMHR